MCAVAPRVPTLTLRLAARALWRRRREQQQASSSSSSWRDSGTWREVEALRDAWDEANDASSTTTQLPLPDARRLLLAQMAALLVRFYRAGAGGGSGGTEEEDQEHGDGVSVRLAAKLLSKVALNAHALAPAAGGVGGGVEEQGDEGAAYGAALAPRAALLNHSSSPNVFQRFTRGGGGSSSSNACEASFVAIRPVQKGDELCVAYADVSGGGGAALAGPLAVRRALREGYLFDPAAEGGLAAALPLALPPLAAAGEDGDKEAVRVTVLRGEDGALASSAAAADARGAAMTALAGGLRGGVDVSLVPLPLEESAGDDNNEAGPSVRLQKELLALAADADSQAGGGAIASLAASAPRSPSSAPTRPTAVALVGWGEWIDSYNAPGAAEAALASLGRRVLAAERLRLRAAATGPPPREAAGLLSSALRLVEEGYGEPQHGIPPLRLASTQPLALALRSALSDALFSDAVLEGRPSAERDAWLLARDAAAAHERTAPTGWPALGLRLARAASMALRVAQDEGGGAGGGGDGTGGDGGRATAAEGAALGARALRILAASHGSGWGDGASWVVRNASIAMEELRMIASGVGRGG